MKKLIYTQSSGFVYSQYAETTVPLMQYYANKINVDFKYDQIEKKSKYPLFDKYKVGELLNDYDRVLFLDIDILIRPDAPDIFAIVPESSYAALNEGSWCNDAELAARYEYLKRTAIACDMQFVNFDMETGYFNGGVFLANKEHQYLFEKAVDNPALLEITSEQNLLNLRLAKNKTKTFNLPHCFNAMSWKWSRMYIEDNYFIHYAGMTTNERLMRLDFDAAYISKKFGIS